YDSLLNTGRSYNPEMPNKYTSRYLDEALGPRYPVGDGLSYTTFTVSDVTHSSPTIQSDGNVTAIEEVTNTVSPEEATVIQMYLLDVTAS
ncbi:beta-glucosidase, partial [Salmonella enterica subsp. enterica serovar Enteritidis]